MQNITPERKILLKVSKQKSPEIVISKPLSSLEPDSAIGKEVLLTPNKIDIPNYTPTTTSKYLVTPKSQAKLISKIFIGEPPTTLKSPSRVKYLSSSSSPSSSNRRNEQIEDNLVDKCFKPENTLNKFKLISTLGQGTFGKVKLAEHLPSGQKVAIKFIEKKNVLTDRQRASVTRELRLLALMRHPNIILVHELIETSEFVAIVMEYAVGGELFQLIVDNKRLNEKLSRTLFVQIVNATEYCHKHSVIHRDLKPENLLLDKEMNIKLVDFGFVTTFDGARLLDTYCGSPFYAAPEMIKGIKYTGPEVDVWSLGVILYAMLCGKLPFDAKDMRKLYSKISLGEFLCPTFLSPEVRDLLRRMINIEPNERATIEAVNSHYWIKGKQFEEENFQRTTIGSLVNENRLLQLTKIIQQEIMNIDNSIINCAKCTFGCSDWLMPCSMKCERELITIITSFGYSSEKVEELLVQSRSKISLGQSVGRHPILGYYRLIKKIWAKLKISTNYLSQTSASQNLNY